MTMKVVQWACALVLALEPMATARAEVQGQVLAPPFVFAQLGTGLLEIAHLEAGVFVGPHVTVEVMAASDGVYAGHYGGGMLVAIGHQRGARPPRHALLVGARLMLDSHATFDSHGDVLSSYVMLPVGYAFLTDGGFYFRTTVGPIIVRDRTTPDGPTPTIGHEIGLGGPMVTMAFGFAWSWPRVREAVE